MSEKSILIIGAGLGGLAAGCYAQMNGYKTRLFEAQAKPGGVCVSWKRKGYIFDYAVHNVFGVTTNPEVENLYTQVWRELGALKDTKAFSFKEFVQVEDADGKTLSLYTDLDKLETHLQQLSPADSKLIEEFVHTTKKFGGHDLFDAMMGGAGAKLKMLPLLGALMKYSKINIKDYAEQFTDPFLRKAFPTIQYDILEVPVLVPLIFLSVQSHGDGGWPIGGSNMLSSNIERRYLELGGEVTYNAKVKKIIVKDNTAVGVQLEDGSEHYAERVVSNADGYSTIYGLLEGKYVTPAIEAYFKAYPKTQSFGLEVWYGVNMELPNEPHAIVRFLEQPLTVEGVSHDRLDIEVFNFDPTIAPKGETVVKVVMESNYDYWKALSADPQVYKKEKQKVADQIAAELEKRFPTFQSHIEAVDVATPLTAERWTASYRGCQSWPAPSGLQKEVTKNGLFKTLPGLARFYGVGQWAGGTLGLSTVTLMGRDLVKGICKEDGRKFEVQTPK
ncbi:MAG: NAD(P)/FAD-dependent oxidoreductase [Candidatus Bathyarchaeota archaeon]|nr:NAD(P)/FAD-dependent oxidoreductase [Candidatus Bathyarchaeota archaeon]